jgi:phosphoglycolate phosphatase
VTICFPGCILFDLDGTLLDSLPGIEFSVHAAFAACHLPIPNVSVGALIGPPIRTILSRAGNIVDADMLDRLEQAFRVSYDSEGWSQTVCFPEASHVLRIMRQQGRRLFVVSNKPRHISLRILEAEEVLVFFEAVITRDSRSPAYSGKEEMIKVLLAEYRLASRDCLLAGDTMEDAQAAATAGISFAYMTHGYGSLTETSRVPVACTLDRLSEFLPLMAKEIVRD